jgi:hypothetical protein
MQLYLVYAIFSLAFASGSRFENGLKFREQRSLTRDDCGDVVLRLGYLSPT